MIGENFMSEHKFNVGDAINFTSYLRGAAAPGKYEVTARRPPQDGEPSYRIKSELERHERIARESELTWIR